MESRRVESKGQEVAPKESREAWGRAERSPVDHAKHRPIFRPRSTVRIDVFRGCREKTIEPKYQGFE